MVKYLLTKKNAKTKHQPDSFARSDEVSDKAGLIVASWCVQNAINT